MIDPFAFLRGSIRHMKLIGEDPQHKALRARNEARLAALKSANRLYEDKTQNDDKSVAARCDPFITEYNSYYGLANDAATERELIAQQSAIANVYGQHQFNPYRDERGCNWLSPYFGSTDSSSER